MQSSADFMEVSTTPSLIEGFEIATAQFKRFCESTSAEFDSSLEQNNQNNATLNNAGR